MKICKNCQTKLSDNEFQCPTCGTRTATIVPREDKNFVKERLEKEWAEGTSKRIEPKNEKNKAVVIIVCLIVMAFLWQTLSIFSWIIVVMGIVKLIKMAIANIRGK